MKTSQIIIRGLISGRIKMSPEVLAGLERIIRAEDAAPKQKAPDRDSQEPPPTTEPLPPPQAPHRCGAPRLVLVSPIPGRWIRKTGCLLAGVLLAGNL
jgi:hypothetical protein